MTDLNPPAVPHEHYLRLLEAARLVAGETYSALAALEKDGGPDVAAAIEALQLAQEIFEDWWTGQQINRSAFPASTGMSDGILDVSIQEIEEWFGMVMMERSVGLMPWYLEYQVRLMNSGGDVFLTKCAVKTGDPNFDVRAFFKAWGRHFADGKQGRFSFGQPPREPAWYSVEFVPPLSRS